MTLLLFCLFVSIIKINFGKNVIKKGCPINGQPFLVY